MRDKELDLKKIRADFPALHQTIYKSTQLVYLDNAATTQKPQVVLDTISEAYTSRNANIHRGVHYLSREATAAHEDARTAVATFINAQEPAEVLFTRGTTESINLVATTFAQRFMQPGDEVIVSRMEHHSNIVPWQMLEQSAGIKLRVVPFSEEGVLDIESYKESFNEKTKLVSLCYASNVLGTINPIKKLVEIAHQHGVPLMADAAQAVAHRPVDVQDLGVDFLAFSGHKLYGPTGIGVLYGKRKWLEELTPYQGGGEMIERVNFERGTTYNELPYKFEAGTPDFVGSVALAAAIRYLQEIGWETIMRHERDLLEYATDRLSQIPNLRIYGTAEQKEAVISFLIDQVHPYDVGALLDKQGVALRTGHHCTQPLMEHYGITGTLRASFALYNTREEVDAFIHALERAIALLG
ncbi:MAG: cysteine desulfurase [Porphyromonas sp.]|nr:cysteine desulfurase [Porphyromonas sp.]